ncbi:MAG: methyltransferase domain-containing protein [Planctomycetaceae bacterium]|jgi:arsenite methyltransferase|nr:methyltransferase domain-containing protein [Planctomycetaceae bacterium]
MDLKSPTKDSTSKAEESVYNRYAGAAQAVEAELCCPVTYDPQYLKILPEEILERDYGCGDPSAFVKPGDTVLDLGSGGGKICYIASQIVGEAGRIIGVDCNDEMLELARKYQQEIGEKVGFHNVEFHRGLIQDLKLDLDQLSKELNQHPVTNHNGWLNLRQLEDRLRNESPMIANDSVDCVVSNCVLNLVRPQDRTQLIAEVFRVLKNGGRAAISDIVCDEDVPEHLQADPTLWSGCISGAFREDKFLQAFEDAGFHGIELVKRESEPWQTVQGIEFRSVTIVAWKGKHGPCLERKQAVIYNGPFSHVKDDDGHIYKRGERTAVCDKTYNLLQQPPYDGLFEPVAPYRDIPLADATEMDCRRNLVRDPQETKGRDYQLTIAPTDCCTPDGDCC